MIFFFFGKILFNVSAPFYPHIFGKPSPLKPMLVNLCVQVLDTYFNVLEKNNNNSRAFFCLFLAIFVWTLLAYNLTCVSKMFLLKGNGEICQINKFASSWMNHRQRSRSSFFIFLPVYFNAIATYWCDVGISALAFLYSHLDKKFL